MNWCPSSLSIALISLIAFSNAWSEKFGVLSINVVSPFLTAIIYPANTVNDAPDILPKSALSPRLPTPMPSANTLRELPFNLAGCGTQKKPFLMKCGASLSPLVNIALPLANTDLCFASTGAVLEHKCPVMALSLCLDILGIAVFMDAKNSVISYRGGE